MAILTEAQEQAVLTALIDWDATDVAPEFGITIDDIQALCGRRGHTFETTDSGDMNTPYYTVYRQCIYCGAPDESEGDDP